MEEGRQPIPAGVRRGQRQDPGTPDFHSNGRDPHILADREGASRELDEEVRLRVEALGLLSREANAGHRLVERRLTGRRLDDQVQVLRRVDTARVDRGARTADEDCGDTGRFEGARHDLDDLSDVDRAVIKVACPTSAASCGASQPRRAGDPRAPPTD